MYVQDVVLGGAHYSDNRRDGSAGDKNKVALSGADATVQRQRKRWVGSSGPGALTLYQ